MTPVRPLTLAAAACCALVPAAVAQPAPPGGGPPPPAANAAVYDLGQLPAIKGTVSRFTLTPRGDVDGQDGTILRLPPPEAERLADVLVPGQTVAVRGDGLATAMGRVAEVDTMAGSQSELNAVERPRPPPRGPRP